MMTAKSHYNTTSFFNNVRIRQTSQCQIFNNKKYLSIVNTYIENNIKYLPVAAPHKCLETPTTFSESFTNGISATIKSDISALIRLTVKHSLSSLLSCLCLWEALSINNTDEFLTFFTAEAK